MPNLYREWCSKVDRRKGRMVPLSAISVLEASYDPGYMSVYMFDQEAALKISSSGSSKGMNKFPVHSDTLYIDIDSGEQDLRDCLAKLDKEGIGYYVYSSGHKGHHVVINLDRVYSGNNVPYSQCEWVRSRNIRCDFSVYRAGSLISMPGRVHSKTGLKKKLVHKKDGKRPSLTLIDPPTPTFEISQSDNDSLQIGLSQLAVLAAGQPGEGTRHVSIWKSAKSLAEAGLAYETTLDLLTVVNDSWPSPKSSAEVEQAVKSAYGA